MFEEVDRRLVFGVIVIAVVAIGLWSYSFLQTSKVINAVFGKAQLKDGESTTLTVDLQNPYNYDYSNVVISVKPVDPISITVGGSPQTEVVFGKGETRKFLFTISIAQTARQGTYSLDILANFGPQNQTKRVLVEVVP